MRKFLIAFLALLCLTLTGFAFACNKEPTYYILTYNEQDGVTFDFGEIKSGAEVREGYEVNFKVTFDDKVEGSKEVRANNDLINPDENGVYTFVMSEDTLVSVNAWLVSDYTINFDMGVTDESGNVTNNENMMWYQDVDGNNLEELERTCTGGDVVSFKIKTSVYCSESAEDFRVTANTMVLIPDNDGIYSFTVTGNTNINVVGLQTDEEMFYRQDGSGTADDPYIIRKPIDLFAMAVYLEDTYYQGRYNTMCYKLGNDIDLKGERLYSIGEYPDESSIAIFCGTFDGDGHTISNYYIEDYIIDQSNGQRVALSNVGFFGVCSATIGSPVTIKNLNLKDFKMVINGSTHSSGFYVGGLVGYGVGVNIINCSIDGTIEANGSNEYFCNVGGIIGFQQSVYQSEDIMRSSFITSCSSNVTVSCPSGNIYAAGGIAGIVSSAEDVSNAYIADCYSTGNVTGAMYTGGIAGTISSYSSVTNCYATGRISARGIGLIGGSDIYSTAYAGGIVGYASGDSIVSGSAFAGRVPSSSQTVVSGNIIGGKDTGNELIYINTKEAVEFNNAQTTDGLNFKTALGWSEGVWNFDEGLPTLKANPEYSGIAVTAVFTGGNVVSGEESKVYEVEGYKSMAEIYRTKDSLPRYIGADNGRRSFGYYFDPELTHAVPLSYVPTGAVTVYAGFADYTKAAGKYYFRTEGGSSSVFAELTADGKMYYRNGALNYETDYVFDGENIILYASPATVIDVPDRDSGSTTVTYTSYNVPALAEYSKSGELNFNYSIFYNNTLYSSTVVAVEDGHSISGVYYGAEAGATEYTFYKDGSGMKGTHDYFTYTVNGSEITLTIRANETETAVLTESAMTINGKLYTVYDKLIGTWVTSAQTHESYEFDGKGGWKYKYAVYNDNGVELSPRATADGTYVLTGGVATLYNNQEQSVGTVTVTSEGFLAINNGQLTQTYYRENSFAGTWTYTSISNPTTVTFYGVGLDGYGKVHVSHLSDMIRGETDEDGNAVPYKGLDLYYEIADGVVYIYNGEILYGQLSYSYASGTLNGYMYLSQTADSASEVMFCLYDVYYGDWVESTAEVTPFESVKFNGLGSYDIAGSTGVYSRVRGTIKIGNSVTNITYKLTHSLMEGAFTYNNVEYTLSYDRVNDTVVISDGTNEYRLERAQA